MAYPKSKKPPNTPDRHEEGEAPTRYLLLRGRPPGARLLAPEGAPRPPLFTPHRTLPLPRSPGEGKVLPTQSANGRVKEECGGEGQGVHSRVLPHQCRPIGERGESPSNAISQSESEGRIFSLQLYIARVRACTAAVSGTCSFAYLWYKESGRRKSLFFILSSQNCKTSTGK